MKVRKKWLRLEDYEFKEMIDTYRLGLRECSYDEARNWIFGAPAPPLFRPLRTHSPPFSVSSQHEIKNKTEMVQLLRL